MTADIRAIIEGVVRERFEGVGGIETVHVAREADYDGDDVFRITIVFDSKTAKSLDAHITTGLARHLRRALRNEDEDAFPIVSFISKADAASLKPEAA